MDGGGVRVFVALTLSTLPLMAAPSVVLAQDEDMPPEGQAAISCYEAKDWNCAFDNGVALMKTEGYIAGCVADTQHGCGYQIYFLYVTGVGASATANNTRRREIAERGLELVRPMNDGMVETDGEILFSALRYDACKSMGDRACMEDSASLLRLAHENPYYDEDDPGSFLDDAEEETGVRFPLDIHAIMAEVAGTEKLQ